MSEEADGATEGAADGATDGTEAGATDADAATEGASAEEQTGSETDAETEADAEEDEEAEYDVLFDPEIATYLAENHEYGRRTVCRKAQNLAEEPYPHGEGDVKEALPFGAENWYVLRVSRAWTIFYLVDEAAREVRVVDVQKPRSSSPKYDL